VRLRTRIAAAEDRGPIGHLEHVRHVAGRGSVEHGDRHAVVEHIEHLGDEHAGVIADRLARLEIHLHFSARGKVAHEFDQRLHLVARARDVVPAAEIDPLHARDQLGEALFERRHGALERRKVLLAQGMEMQAAQSVEIGFANRRARRAEPRILRARVVERDRRLGMLRIDAQPEAQALLFLRRLERERPEPAPLPGRIEDHVVGELEHFLQVVFAERGAERVHFAAELLAAEARFVRAARAGAGKVARDERCHAPHRERLQREQDLRAAFGLHAC